MSSPSALLDDTDRAHEWPAVAGPAADAVASPSAAASWYAPAERRRSRWSRRRARSAAVVGPASWFAAQSAGDAPVAVGSVSRRTVEG